MIFKEGVSFVLRHPLSLYLFTVCFKTLHALFKRKVYCINRKAMEAVSQSLSGQISLCPNANPLFYLSSLIPKRKGRHLR